MCNKLVTKGVGVIQVVFVLSVFVSVFVLSVFRVFSVPVPVFSVSFVGTTTLETNTRCPS
jgi:hypothetical protein